jgi:hypothetical protein
MVGYWIRLDELKFQGMVKENLNHVAIFYFNVSSPSGIRKMNGVACSSRIPQANLPPVLSFLYVHANTVLQP